MAKHEAMNHVDMLIGETNRYLNEASRLSEFARSEFLAF